MFFSLLYLQNQVPTANGPKVNQPPPPLSLTEAIVTLNPNARSGDFVSRYSVGSISRITPIPTTAFHSPRSSN